MLLNAHTTTRITIFVKSWECYFHFISHTYALALISSLVAGKLGSDSAWSGKLLKANLLTNSVEDSSHKWYLRGTLGNYNYSFDRNKDKQFLFRKDLINGTMMQAA